MRNSVNNRRSIRTRNSNSILGLLVTVIFLFSSSHIAIAAECGGTSDTFSLLEEGLIPVNEITEMDAAAKYECLANNPNCAVFYAIDSDPHFAQDKAMDLCFHYSNLCRPLGCHRLP